MDNRTVGSTPPCHLAQKKNAKSVLFFSFFLLITSSFANAQETQELGVILGTIKNFMDYYHESIDVIRENGSSSPLMLPQTKDSPGLGPINVLPEFSEDLGLAFSALYLLDVPTIPFEFRFYISTPEVPTISRKVVGITEGEGFTDPHIPPLRWTADGRLGVESQVGGSLKNPDSVKLYLLAPEKLNKPFVESPAGPSALVMDKFEIPFNALAQGRTGSIQHTNICDPYIKAEGERRNPYSCGVGGEDDCYDVTLISAYVRLSNTPDGDNIPPKLDDWDRVMGTPLNIRVSNPKTTQASIEEVTYGESKFSPNRTGILFETITPADGRLFVARRGYLPLVWENTVTGEVQGGSYDVVYGVSPLDAEPCDVSYWGDLYPITHAPHDKRVNERYGFAMQPFRDPSGAVIPDGVDIKGTYPWMDKEAKNFSVQVSPAKLFPSYSYDKNPQSRYPVRCVSNVECSIEGMKDSDNSKDNMFVVMGAWTQGKMILLDGKLNDVDFRLGGTDKEQSYLSLYKPGTGQNPNNNGEVRVGATRGWGGGSVQVTGDSGGVLGQFLPGNLSMFDSIENRLNYLPNLKHSRFQDVVWNVSSGHSTVELSFDDYLNPDGFIVSNMVANLRHKNSNWYRMNYYDGWHQLTRSFNGQVRVQNSATALPDRWDIPAHGRVYNGRLEPVANGGIRGKGMWFNGRTTRIDYAVTEQPQSVHDSDWFYSLFIDPRFGDDDTERVLVRFPDRSQITVKGRRAIKFYNSRQRLITKMQLPTTLPEQNWSHLALLVKADEEFNNKRSMSLFINGFQHQTWSALTFESNIERDNFRPTPGKLRIGRGSGWGRKQAFEGWIDEFKVFAYEPNLESICNFGHGTLVGLPASYQGEWDDISNRYQRKSHDYVSHELATYGQSTYQKYACYHDYSNDNEAHLFNIPDGLISLRESFNFPEGPLYFDAPRPDSNSNEFCLSCHHDAGVAGLGLQALALDTSVNTKEDPRRQPTQPPAKIYGNLPANWFAGSPEYSSISGANGQHIDEWIMPSAGNVDLEIRNLVLADEEGGAWQVIKESEAIELASLPDKVTQIRANVSGLVRQVTFEINGSYQYDSYAPFTFGTAFLQEGTNEIKVTAHDDMGAGTTVVFQVETN